MAEFFSTFNGLELFFLICSIMGGFFVFLKLILQFAGGDIDADTGIESDPDIGSAHADSDAGFRFLSLHGFSAFFMMFGLVGLALYQHDRVGIFVSILGAVIAGIISVWVIGKLFQAGARLQSSGTLQTADAVGSKGTVYLTIPAGGTGRVTINFKNRLREFDAVEKSGQEVTTGSPIRVVRVNANILVVETIH